MAYIDDFLILDTLTLVCAHRVEGRGENDGMYGIALLVRVGPTIKRVFADYPDEHTRNAAFVALGKLVQQLMRDPADLAES